MKIKFSILVTIFLVSSVLSTDAFSMAHDKFLKDLSKAAEQLNKDLNNKPDVTPGVVDHKAQEQEQDRRRAARIKREKEEDEAYRARGAAARVQKEAEQQKLEKRREEEVRVRNELIAQQEERDRVRQEEAKIARKNLDEEMKKKNLERASKQIPFKKKMNLQCIIIVRNTPLVYQYQLDGKAVWFNGAKMELGVAVKEYSGHGKFSEVLMIRENNIVKYSAITHIADIEIFVDIRTLKAEMLAYGQKFLGNCSVI
jgi:flagellar biosynthesis GTPase FlhF